MYRLRHKETKQIATPEELKYLRVNTDGVVEKLIDWFHASQEECETLQSVSFPSEYEDTNIYYYWQPAPEWEVLLDEVNNG